MRLILFFATFAGLCSTTFAADPVYPPEIGTWSNYSQGGGTMSVARYRMGFDDDIKIPADYRICASAKSATVTFENSETVGKPERDDPKRVDIVAGECGCIDNATAVNFRSGYNVDADVFGTYEAFAPGSGCKGIRKSISFPEVKSLSCEPLFNPGQPVAFSGWNAVKCVVPIADKRDNYRICTARDSIVLKDDKGIYPIGLASIVTDAKLGNHFPLGTTGQPLGMFAAMTGNCIDLYKVNHIVLLVGSYPITNLSYNALLIDKVTVTLQMIGE